MLNNNKHLSFTLMTNLIFVKMLRKSLLEEFIQDMDLFLVVLALFSHSCARWSLTRYTLQNISPYFTFFFQNLQNHWDSWVNIAPSSRILVLFLEPHNLACVGVSFQSLHQSGIVKRSYLFDSDYCNILNYHNLTYLFSSFFFSRTA